MEHTAALGPPGDGGKGGAGELQRTQKERHGDEEDGGGGGEITEKSKKQKRFRKRNTLTPFKDYSVGSEKAVFVILWPVTESCVKREREP